MKTDSLSQERKKNLRLFLRRMTARKIVLFGLIGTLLFVILALFAPLIATADPNEMAMLDKLADPSSAHWFGTDMYGRDIFSRVVYGAQVSLIIGVTSVLLASIVGCFLGMLAAYNGGIGHVNDARRLARSHGENPDSWETVARYLALKALPEYYEQQEVRCGRFTGGSQTRAYVRDVLKRYDRYCRIAAR